MDKLFKSYQDQSTHTKNLCDLYGLHRDRLTFEPDGSINSSQSVFIRQNVRKLQLKFNKVDGDFEYRGASLETLEGSPRIVTGSFTCDNNRLTTLYNGPLEVGHNYSCIGNNLINVNGFPVKIDKNSKISLAYNPVYYIISMVRSNQYIKYIHLLNEYNVIFNDKKVDEVRLDQAYYTTTGIVLGLELKESFVRSGGYKLI